MKVTRTLQANSPPSLVGICKPIGFVRADIWRRYGALGNVGKSAGDIRTEITARACYAHLPVDGTIRNETTKDIVNDILFYKAAAMAKVRKSIAARTKDKQERKRLYTLLKQDAWPAEPFLHRQMRKHFKHGKSSVSNQFVVRSDMHSSEIVDGKLVITIRVARKYGDDIVLTTTTSGEIVDLTGSNLRIVAKEGFTEIHYATEKGAGRKCGDKIIGVDKGYTEAFTDSNGDHHGLVFGKLMTEYSDKACATSKQRNKLYALEKKHREAGNTAKADRIKKHNLGRKKVNARKATTQKHLRTIAYQSVHSIVDKAAVMTARFATKHQWKRFNRIMNSWAKGVLAEALDSFCTQREARHVLVNGAYTSQMDSTTGLLEGKRVGDTFYRANGDVLQSDHNATLNVLARLDDPDIKLFTPDKEVRPILSARSPAQLSVKGLELGGKPRQPSADKSYAHLCATF